MRRRIATCMLALVSFLSTLHAADPPAAVQDIPLQDLRSSSARRTMLAGMGGSANSEKAVRSALAWLAAHQMNDGGWSFNHGLNNKHVGPVNNPGSERSTIGATSLVLVTFLGAGETHKEGAYKETIQQGFFYLIKSRNLAEKKEPAENAACEAWAAIALCEALLLTQDRALAEPARQAVSQVLALQDKESGGWRSADAQPCDALTTAWAVNALKSARLAKVEVSPDRLTAAD
jgi:hypothetical protein